MALQLTPEQEQQIIEAKKLLPEGFEVYQVEQVREITQIKNDALDKVDLYDSVLRKLKPFFEIITALGGSGEDENVMSLLPQLIMKAAPLLAPLKADEGFIKDLVQIIVGLK